MYKLRVKENKIKMVKKEYARLGHICDVVRVTGYSRTLVHCVVNDCFEMIPAEFKDPIPQNTCNVDDYPATEPANMENFGSLQYIIDKLPVEEQLVITECFVHETSITEIAIMIGKTRKVVDRILQNLQNWKI